MVWGLGFKVQDLRFGAEGKRFTVEFYILALGLYFYNSGLRV
jgi:uncharacterized protein (DUF2164 family)